MCRRRRPRCEGCRGAALDGTHPRGGQPVRPLGRVGRFVDLQVDVERTVAVVDQALGAVTDRGAVDRVDDRPERWRVVHGQRPEGVHGRRRVEVQDVAVRSGEGLVVCVHERRRIPGLVGVVAPDRQPGCDRSHPSCLGRIVDPPLRAVDRAELEVVGVVVEHLTHRHPRMTWRNSRLSRSIWSLAACCASGTPAADSAGSQSTYGLLSSSRPSGANFC